MTWSRHVVHLTPVLRARRAAVNKQANTGHTFAALCHRPLWFQGTSLASGDPVPVGSHRPPSGVLPKKPPVTQSHKARPAVSQGYFRNCPVTFTYHVHCLALETESLVQLEFCFAGTSTQLLLFSGGFPLPAGRRPVDTSPRLSCHRRCPPAGSPAHVCVGGTGRWVL